MSRMAFEPRVGDIIVFKSPKHGHRLAMKRVAAVQGESITPSKVVKSGEKEITVSTHNHGDLIRNVSLVVVSSKYILDSTSYF